jgi:hypothetical protein
MQQAKRRTAATDSLRVPLEQLSRDAQVLAHQPQQVLHRALLAPRRAVAVVQDEDHARGALEAHIGDKLL